MNTVCRYQPMQIADEVNTHASARDCSNVMRITEDGEHHAQSTSTKHDSEAKQDYVICNRHDVLLVRTELQVKQQLSSCQQKIAQP